jgi:hypothetical protein
MMWRRSSPPTAHTGESSGGRVEPLVKPLGGTDISWIVGFALASLLYLTGAKRFAGAREGLPAADPLGSAS